MRPVRERRSAVRIRRRLAGLAAAGLLLATGCSADRGAAIDPPPAGVEQAMLEEAMTAAAAASAEGDALTVYLMDRNGYAAPLTLRLPASPEGAKTPAETAVQWLTEDAGRATQLPEGFAAPLPAVSNVRSVKVDAAKGEVAVDFASAFPALPARLERKAVEALVWTMTELQGIGRVRLTVDGAPLRKLPASGLPLADALDRGFGINLERAAGVETSRSMAVTLYFAARSPGGDGYFVPVTRLIDRHADRARAALQELIAGPLDRRSLLPVLTSDLTVDKLSLAADTVSVGLREHGWITESSPPDEMLEAIALTLAAATGASSVQVAMNGNDNYTPVDLPSPINAWER